MGQELAMQVLAKSADEPEGSSSIFQDRRDRCGTPL